MSHNIIHMVPGPVSVPDKILQAMCVNADAGHIKADFIEEYNTASAKLARLMGTQNDIVLMSGEAMVILWGALRSCLKSGDKLLCIDTGVFGAGFADMGKSFGIESRLVSFEPNTTINQGNALQRIEDAVKEFKPTMITVVHCETPSGTLNPITELGEIKKRLNVPLLVVDAVASVGGVPVEADKWNADIVMGGTQKALSAPPCMGFASVSPKAWEAIKAVKYAGYDAFLPFYQPKDGASMPYTPFRQGTAAITAAADLLFEEGLPNVFARHEEVAKLCREGIKELGLEMFTHPEAINAPTVSAVKVPTAFTWPEWRSRLMQRGLVPAGGLAYLEGKLFRLGHMGVQAQPELIKEALKIMANAL
ncbi:aminotransferase class V-fold PLP-dependent enzyme [Desulfovibrio sp. OttesenSCG-928-F07]|nr:aminotransferase class V-fold PLP-dependent enzyme [Desulfovibrio sp. OttesenSCG-928-F07]